MRNRILNANCPRRRARTRRGEHAGGSFEKGVPHGERMSVACYDDLEDVRWNCRETWPTRGTDTHVQ